MTHALNFDTLTGMLVNFKVDFCFMRFFLFSISQLCNQRAIGAIQRIKRANFVLLAPRLKANEPISKLVIRVQFLASSHSK